MNPSLRLLFPTFYSATPFQPTPNGELHENAFTFHFADTVCPCLIDDNPIDYRTQLRYTRYAKQTEAWR